MNCRRPGLRHRAAGAPYCRSSPAFTNRVPLATHNPVLFQISSRSGQCNGHEHRHSCPKRNQTEQICYFPAQEAWIKPTAEDLARHGAESDHGVQSSECKGIRKSGFNLMDAGLVWNVVQVAFRIAFVVIRSRRQDSMMQSEHCGDRFERTCSAERMAMHGLSRTDREFFRVRAKNFANGAAFDWIVSRCAGAVGVDITDFLRRHVG